MYSGEPASTSVCSGLSHLLRVWEELPIPVRLLMQVSSHFRGPSSPGFTSWKTDFLLCCSSLLREPRKNSFSISEAGWSDCYICVYTYMCVYFLCLWDCFTLFFRFHIPYECLRNFKSIRVSDAQSEFAFSISISPEGFLLYCLVCTRFAFSGHLAGAWQIMWVRMLIMGCFATRAACCRAVPMKQGLIAQLAGDVWGRVQALQASCKSRETERVCMSRRGIYSSFLCVSDSFWNSELEFAHGEGGKITWWSISWCNGLQVSTGGRGECWVTPEWLPRGFLGFVIYVASRT